MVSVCCVSVSWLHSAADWRVGAEAAHSAAVCVLRVDDEPGVVSDRNWPSGVLRLADGRAAQLEHAAGAAGMQPNRVALLQVQSSGTNTDAPCSSAAGHVEPLLPAAGVFDHCAGVSHPVFTGRPAAWIPFLPHRDEERFATLFYDGIIDFNTVEAAWTRRKHTAVLDVMPEPFAAAGSSGPSKRAVIRAGSVIKFRAPSAARDSAGSAGDSQRTASTVSDEAANAEGLLGVVLLTYVRVSTEYTSVWSDQVAAELRTRDPDADAAGLEDLRTFTSLFPGTPVALCAVQRLIDDDLVRGPIHFYPDVNVCDVIDVCDADPSKLLWSPVMSSTRQGKHLVVKPVLKAGKRRASGKASAAAPNKLDLVEQEVSLQQCRVERYVTYEYQDPNSSFSQWFAGSVKATRSRAHATSSPTPQLHSFYHDVVRGAQRSSTTDRTRSLMTIRRIINVPQPQPPLSEEVADKSQPPIAARRTDAPAQESDAAAPDPAAAEANASAAKRVRYSRRSNEATTDPAREQASAAPTGDAPTRRTGRSSAGSHTAAAKEKADWTVWLFGELANMDVSEAGAPFASLLQPSAQSKKKNAKLHYQPAYKTFSQQSKQELAVLQSHAGQLMLAPPPYGAKAGAKAPLTAEQRESVCSELAALPVRPVALMWVAHAGKRPPASAPSCRDRVSLAAPALKLQQQPQESDNESDSGSLRLPINAYLQGRPDLQAIMDRLDQRLKAQDAKEAAWEQQKKEEQKKMDAKLEAARADAAAAAAAAAEASPTTSSASKGRSATRAAPSSAGANACVNKRKPAAASNSSSAATTSTGRDTHAAAEALRSMPVRVADSHNRLRHITRSSTSRSAEEDVDEEDEADDDEAEAADVVEPPAKRRKGSAGNSRGQRHAGAKAAAASASPTTDPALTTFMESMSKSMQAMTDKLDTQKIAIMTAVDDRVNKTASELAARVEEKCAQTEAKRVETEQKYDKLQEEINKIQTQQTHTQQFLMGQAARMWGVPAQSQQSLSPSQVQMLMAAATAGPQQWPFGPSQHLLGPPPQQALVPVPARTIDAHIVTNGHVQPLTGYSMAQAQWPWPRS